MKKLFVVLFVVIFAATSAYAFELETKGLFNVRGSYINNNDGLQVDSVDYMYYDGELDITHKLVVDENTFVRVNYEIRDQNWLTSPDPQSKIVDGADADDYISFKRVFGSYKWTSTGTQLDLGLMTGGAWASDFANNAKGYWRLKLVQSTPIGPFIALLQKNAEIGQTDKTRDDAEKDDGDSYAVAMVTKIGPVNFKPLIHYIHASNLVLDGGSDGLTRVVYALGMDWAGDVWGWETDFQVDDRDYSGMLNDLNQTAYGLYGKVWFKTGPAKIAATLAYASEDEGLAFGYGDDFGAMTVMGNWIDFGPNNNEEIAGSTLLRLQLNYSVTETLSFNGALAYVDSNMTDNLFWKGATAWEFDLGLRYMISPAITYDIAFGYADIDLEEKYSGQPDPDAAQRLYHSFTIRF